MDALQPAVAAFVRDMVSALTALVSQLPSHDAKQLEHDVASEAFGLTAALIDVDWCHTDDELWALIMTFGSWMPGQLALARPDDVRKASIVAGKARWLERPSTMFELLADADRRNGTTHSRTYYDRAMQIAFTVASLDQNPSTAELRAIDVWRGLLLEAMHDIPPAGAGGGGQGRRPGSGPDTRTRSSGAAEPQPSRTPAPAPRDGAPAATTGATTAPPADTATVVDEPPRPIEELLSELDHLVGLARVKAEVRLVTNLLRVQKLRLERHLPVSDQSRHLVFTGNPGTGKTTVARLLAQIYRTLGVVARGHLVETDRSGLVSGYVGQTALKVKAVFDQADQGVLLIDEAYALARGGENDFGREAIDTIVKLIEDRRDSVVVIAAGYTDEMAVFIDANPGLRSRFPKTIEFPDYSDDELWAIFKGLGDKAGYRCDADAEAKVRSWLAAQPRDKGFGNARLARNLFEDAVARQASRMVALPEPTDVDLTTLVAADIADVANPVALIPAPDPRP